MKKQNLLKHVIRACKGRYDIAELTIIDGYDILFSGAIDKFEAQCDVSMILYRDELLKREVIAKNIFGANNTKLFVFLKNNSNNTNKLLSSLKHEITKLNEGLFWANKNSVHKLSYDEANEIKNVLLGAYKYIKENTL